MGNGGIFNCFYSGDIRFDFKKIIILITIRVTVNWSTPFDRARPVTLKMIFWWIKDLSADDQLCVQRWNLFERRENVPKQMENVSKPAEYVLDRSISERPRRTFQR